MSLPASSRAVGGGPPRLPIEVAPAEFLVLEGVSASRGAFRPFLAYAIWVETPRAERLRRVLARDGTAHERNGRSGWPKRTVIASGSGRVNGPTSCSAATRRRVSGHSCELRALDGTIRHD